MRRISLAIAIVFVVMSISNCDEDEETLVPTTGSVSGTVTFMDSPPAGDIEVQVSIFSELDESGRPAGPPDHYSEPFQQFTGQVQYEILGVSFGTYKLAALGFELADAPQGTPEIPIGAYGMTPPIDMEPDSFAISAEQPDATGIDIFASYAAVSQLQ